MHLWVEWVRGDREWGRIKVVESVGPASGDTIINVSGEPVPLWRAGGKDVGITAPVWDTEDTGKSGGAFESGVDGLRGAECSNRNYPLIDEGLESARDVLNEGFGTEPAKR